MYNITDIKTYLQEFYDGDVITSPVGKSALWQLPTILCEAYSFYNLCFLEVDMVIAFPKVQKNITPSQLSKHQLLLQRFFGKYIIFGLCPVESYVQKRLAKARVNFIIPRKVIFLPTLMMVLREKLSTAEQLPEKMPSAAQTMVLWHLERESLNGATAKELTEMLGVSYPNTIKSLKWLEANGVLQLNGVRNKTMEFCHKGQQLWKQCLPMMSSPISKRVYANEVPKHIVKAGETALAECTMLAEPPKPVYATTEDALKNIPTSKDPNFGDYQIEVWRYNPLFLTKTIVADMLSLYLSLHDSDDERVRKECKNLLKEMKW